MCICIVNLQNCHKGSMKLQHTSNIYAAYAAGYDTIRVIAVGFQLHLQYGCSVYCSAAYAANMLQFKAQKCSMNAVGLQHMLRVQYMLQFCKGWISLLWSAPRDVLQNSVWPCCSANAVIFWNPRRSLATALIIHSVTARYMLLLTFTGVNSFRWLLFYGIGSPQKLFS